MRQRQPRVVDPEHLAFVRALPCCVCGNDIETEAAHIRFADPRAYKRPVGKGERPDDTWAIPLCGKCHREQHRMSEPRFWASAGIDPVFVALALTRVSGDTQAGCEIVAANRGR